MSASEIEDFLGTPSRPGTKGPAPDPALVDLVYQRDASKLHRYVDGVFVRLLIVQWAFAIGYAWFVAPQTWEGPSSSPHPHLMQAIFFGAVVNAVPIWLVQTQPGTLLSRCAISTAQALWSGMLIHLGGGRIEMHFHIFGSLALLSFYRDWRALVPATVVVTCDHFIRGLYLPASIYGVEHVETWRFLEHTSWILFEDYFLFISCVRSRREMEVAAYREARIKGAYKLLENTKTLAEQEVANRSEELASAQVQYKALLEACNAIPWEADFDSGGVFSYIATQVERMTGWPTSCFSEPGFLISCIHPDDRAMFLDVFSSARIDEPGTAEYRFRSKDGSYTTVSNQFIRVHDLEGHRIFRGFILDISKQRTLELELRQSQKLESVGRLAAGVAHEINTPVQFVSDSVQFLQDAARDLVPLLKNYQAFEEMVAAHAELPDELRAQVFALAAQREGADLEYVLEQLPRSIHRSLDGLSRVAEIVRSMKEFSHPDQKRMATVDLNRAIEGTLTIARGEYKQVAEVETRLGKIPPVLCYAGEVNQVLLNIVVNAAHAITDVVAKKGGKGLIRVVTQLEGEMVAISISDSGGGIPPEVAERIFDPFFTTKEVGRGTGQGLAIARSVVQDKHGGRLTFTSIPGRGTTFVVRLPVNGGVQTVSGAASHPGRLHQN